MYPQVSLLSRAARSAGVALRSRELQQYGSSGGNRSSTIQRIILPASAYDYVAESGKLYDNGVVLPVTNWKGRRASEARLMIQERGADDKWAEAKHSPQIAQILHAFEHPNENYGLATMLLGLQLSWDVRGNAYLYKRRNNVGKIGGFWYIPHWQIRPMGTRDNSAGTKLITHYEYTPIGGQKKELEIEDVVQLRFGIDPMDPSSGLSPLAAELRDICADNEVANWLASLLRNAATPGMLFSPKVVTEPPSEEQKKNFKAWIQGFVRDKRGESGIIPIPVDPITLGFNPQQMVLDKLREIPTSRICAALGVDPMVLGLPSDSKTYSNLGEASDSAVKGTVIPDLNNWAGQLTVQCIEDFGLDPMRFRFAFDKSQMAFLSDDTDELHARVREDYRAGIIDRFTAKERIGEMPDDSDKGVYFSGPAADAEPEPAKAKGLRFKSVNPNLPSSIYARFNRLSQSTKRQIAELAKRLIDGHISESEWAHDFDQLLSAAHGSAWGLGRHLSGDSATNDALDQSHGRRVADLESQYLQGFLEDLLNKDSRYYDDDGKFKSEPLETRMQLYRTKLRGTANEALVTHSSDEAEWTWVLGGVEDHCADCPYLAESSPYFKDSLSTYPGSGDTPCLGNCKCHLVRDDGLEGFRPE